MNNRKGVIIEACSPGLYDLTITLDSRPVKTIRYITLIRAKQIMEEELSEAAK